MSDDEVEPASDFGDEIAPAVVAAPLVEPDQGWIADDEPTVVATEAVGDVGPLSAEEAAISVLSEDEAPGLTWGEGPGYVEEDGGDRPGSGADPPGSGGS